MNEVFRNKLFDELGQAKMALEVSVIYSDRHRYRRKVFKWLIFLLSIIGAVGTFYTDKLPTIACASIAVLIAVKEFLPQIVFNDDQLSKLSDIIKFYSGYFNSLESFWFDYDDWIYLDNEKKARDKFYRIKKTEMDIDDTVNELIVNPPNRIKKKATKNTSKYFSKTFNV